jgi:superfamily II DNA or RNA helicase
MPHCQAGSIVHVRGEDWRVARVDAYEGCAILTLDGGAARPPLRIIEPFDRPRLRRLKAQRRPRRVVLRAALGAIAGARPPLGLWTAADAAIDVLPYQLEPALAVLRGATRVLLADAVGLGKTIEAGLILAELRARGWVERALILCPAGLRATWATELQQRFNIACAVLDQAAIAETMAALPPGVNPWSGHATIVASIDLAKRDDVRAALDGIAFDVLIADEAHHLTPGTDRGDTVRRLASRTPWCVFVSATPHSGDAAAFDYLCNLGGHGDGLTIFRRSGPDAGRNADRRERVVRVRPSADETETLAAAAAYARAIWRQHGSRDPAVRLIAITIARRAASSPLALRRTLIRRLSLLSTASEPEQAALPWEEPDGSDADMPATLLCRPGLDDARSERDTLEELVRRLADARAAKIDWLLRFLLRAREPAIVFTEYRDTLDAVLAALPASLCARSICGAHPPELRQHAVDAFNGGGVDVLVATDTAGEGLNLHRRCRLVIDMELPWNPVRLEQRLGRVDRLGQQRRVHALRLVYPNSIEARVLDRVRARRVVSEAEVARWVFDGEPDAADPAWSPRSAAVPAAVAEAARLQRQRRRPVSQAVRHVASVARRWREDAPFLAVHRVTFTNSLGAVLAEYPSAHLVDGHAADRLDAALAARIHRHQAEIDHDLSPLRAAIADRISRIQAQIAGGDSARVIQRSLFDGRAENAARHADSITRQLQSSLERRRIQVASPASAGGATATLVASWPRPRQ